MSGPKDVKYTALFDAAQIAARIKELGAQITRDYGGEPLVCVGVLKGAFIFLADLVRAIDLPLTVEFIGVASYAGTRSTGHGRVMPKPGGRVRLYLPNWVITPR